MKKQVKCISVEALGCEHSLVFRFMRVARWLALTLLLGIGSAGALLQFQRNQDINWMFFAVCTLCGLVLFWIGHCIMQSECATRRRCRTCTKAPSSIDGLPMRQT